MTSRHKGARACMRVAMAGLFALATTGVQATNIVVDDLGDPGTALTCTLRQAISAANTDSIVGTCAAGQPAPTIDTITFSAALNLTPATPQTITLDQSSMSEAPANFMQATPTWLLVISTPMTIVGPGSGALTINGGGLGAGAIGRRSLVVSDGQAMNDLSISISGVSFKEGRNIGGGGGCMSSRESLTLTDVRFEGCEAVGSSPTSTAGGGALTVNVPGAGDVKPNVTLDNVAFVGNRTVHGGAAPANSSCCGAASFGGGAAASPNYIGSVTLSNTQFIGNTAEGTGALRIANGTNATLTNVEFISNSATSFNIGAFQIVSMSGAVTLNGGGALGNSAALRRGGGQIQGIA